MKTSNTILSLCLVICATWNTCTASTNGLTQQKIRIAFFIDKGAHPRSVLCNNLAKEASFTMSYVTGEDICAGCLNSCDVIFFPGGSGKREAASLTIEGQNKVKQFIHDGGIYVGVCAGCYLASCAHPEYLGLFPMTTVDPKHWRRGKAVLPIEFTDLGKNIFGVNEATAQVVYHNGPVLKAYEKYADKIAVLSYFRDEVVAPGGKVGMMTNAPAMILARYGNGLVLGISPHPEGTPGLERIELNAIHWLFNNRIVNQTTANLPKTSVNLENADSSKKDASSDYNLNNAIYNKAEDIFENTLRSHYEHLHENAAEQIQEKNGQYCATTDCSGFVSYVLNSTAPNHYAQILKLSGRTYPHAAIYAEFFRSLPEDKASNGWLRISKFEDLKRGDLIAWEKINSSRKHHGTGHVMIVVNTPEKPIEENYKNQTIKYVEVYVLDSSSIEHFPPQNLPPLIHQSSRDGIGKGMIRLILDDNNNIIGFWEGSFSHERDQSIEGPTYTDKVGLARLISLSHPNKY